MPQKNTILTGYKSLFLTTLGSLQFLFACVTGGHQPQAQPKTATEEPGRQSNTEIDKQRPNTRTDQNTTQSVNTANHAYVTQFEVALSKRDCKTVRILEKQLVAPPESYSNSALLATLWCAHQENPREKPNADRLFSVIDESLKNEAPLFNPTFLETLRAEALTASGDLAAARQSQAKALGLSALEFMNLVSGQVLRAEFQNIEVMLSGGQTALLREVRSNLADPLTQAAALTKFDELISQLTEGPVKDRLLVARLKLFSAIELAFASQLGTLEETRLKKDATSTDELVVKLRKLFPSRPHQLRIDSLVGTQTQSKLASAEAPTNQCSTDIASTKAGQEQVEMSTDRALQLARNALNDGKPGDAVEVLDSLAEAQKNDKTRSLRREASQAHIRDLRRKANELYQRGNLAADNQVKLDSLAQCKQILENILSRYPETDSFTRVKIQKFLNSVSENIVELRKAQLK